MYVCDYCGGIIECGVQFAKFNARNVCIDCAVHNTLDDIMAKFSIPYEEVPEEIVAEGVILYSDTDSMATPEQVEKFFTSENPVFVPTKVGEKNTVLTTLCARTAEDAYKKAWVYESARDAEYWAEHTLKNMPNLISIDGFVSEEEIPDGYIIYRVDGNNDDDTEDVFVEK